MLLCVGRVKREVKKELLKILQRANYWRAAKHWQGSETTRNLCCSGAATKERFFYFDLAMQASDDSPRPGAYIDSLARPSGY